MINFDNYNQGSFIGRYNNILGNRISLNDEVVKNIMTNQGIRKTKNNIQICKNELINFIKSALGDNWKVYHEINGDFGFKC